MVEKKRLELSKITKAMFLDQFEDSRMRVYLEELIKEIWKIDVGESCKISQAKYFKRKQSDNEKAN